MILKISVTQEDIEKGIKQDCTKCPIARAVNRALIENNLQPLSCEVEGPIKLMDWHNDYVMIDKEQAKKINIFINDFDDERKVQPFEMEVKFEQRELDYDD